MKKYLLVFTVMAAGSFAQADLSIECVSSGQKVSLDLTKGYSLSDSAESNLRKAKSVKPVTETKNSVEFFHDFGSDHEIRVYAFTGLQNCGRYGSEEKIVKLTTFIKSFTNEIRLKKTFDCTCAED